MRAPRRSECETSQANTSYGVRRQHGGGREIGDFFCAKIRNFLFVYGVLVADVLYVDKEGERCCCRYRCREACFCRSFCRLLSVNNSSRTALWSISRAEGVAPQRPALCATPKKGLAAVQGQVTDAPVG